MERETDGERKKDEERDGERLRESDGERWRERRREGREKYNSLRNTVTGIQ